MCNFKFNFEVYLRSRVGRKWSILERGSKCWYDTEGSEMVDFREGFGGYVAEMGRSIASRWSILRCWGGKRLAFFGFEPCLHDVVVCILDRRWEVGIEIVRSASLTLPFHQWVLRDQQQWSASRASRNPGSIFEKLATTLRRLPGLSHYMKQSFNLKSFCINRAINLIKGRPHRFFTFSQD